MDPFRIMTYMSSGRRRSKPHSWEDCHRTGEWKKKTNQVPKSRDEELEATFPYLGLSLPTGDACRANTTSFRSRPMGGVHLWVCRGRVSARTNRRRIHFDIRRLLRRVVHYQGPAHSRMIGERAEPELGMLIKQGARCVCCSRRALFSLSPLSVSHAFSSWLSSYVELMLPH